MPVLKACKINELKIFKPRVQIMLGPDMTLMAVNLLNR